MFTQGFRKFYGSITEALKTIFQMWRILISSPPHFAKYIPVYLHTPHFAKYTPVFVFLTGFFPKHHETLQIMQRYSFCPSEMLRDFTDYAIMLFLTSRMLRIFTDCATMLVLISWMLQDFTDYVTTPIFFPECCETLRITQQCSFSSRNVVKLYGLRNDACFEGSKGSKQGSRTDHKYSRTKLGYDNPKQVAIQATWSFNWNTK